jgi:ubiquinone/menaquinone biosynthesis C-methylase UbiE
MNISTEHARFQQHYLLLRQKEGRLYSDEQVKQLPFISTTHPLWKEWKIRKESCDKLINDFSRKEKSLNILEIGCGNGWLCNRLSAIADSNITGIDINETELKQAVRVFPAVNFIYGDIRDCFLEKQFDAIVFAASFQYFCSAKEILESCFFYLNEKGEVHILDTNFYSEETSPCAVKRSEEYFSANGFPQMSEFYFHHTLNELEDLNYDILYDPKRKLNRLFHQNPFPWIRIKK